MPSEDLNAFVSQQLRQATREMGELEALSQTLNQLPDPAVDPEDTADCIRRMEAILAAFRQTYEQAQQKDAVQNPLGPEHPVLARLRRDIVVCEALREHFQEMEGWYADGKGARPSDHEGSP